MIQKIKILLVTLFIIPIYFSCTSSEPSDPDSLNESTLRVALDLDMPGHFIFNGQTLGYQYELLQAYADHLGTGLSVVSENTPQAYQRGLSQNRLDMVATLKTHPNRESDTIVPIYSTSYVVLASKKSARSFDSREKLYTQLSGRKILVSNRFLETDSYHELMDSLRDTEIFLSSRNTFELMESLNYGHYDFLICEQSEAHLGSALIRTIREVYAFSEQVPVGLLFDKNHSGYLTDFTQWLSSYRASAEGKQLEKLYFDRRMAYQIICGGFNNRTTGTISNYDALFTRIGKELHYDWRMIAAIAYKESRFTPYLVSPRGAMGLMQVMPKVGEIFGVSQEQLMEPEQNVRVAVKLLQRIERSLKLPPETHFNDRMSIVLACYNGGIGHVTDARKLAAKHGGDPNSWADVSHYLTLKSQALYAEDEIVRCGTFNGAAETNGFVAGVMEKYQAYSGTESPQPRLRTLVAQVK